VRRPSRSTVEHDGCGAAGELCVQIHGAIKMRILFF
jgi:hypothetical protein